MEKVIGAVRSKTNWLLFWTLTLAGLGLLFLVAALPVAQRRALVEEQVRSMTEENQSLQGENDSLERERYALTSDPFYIEKIARRELNMCRPGEMQVRLMPAALEESTTVRPKTAGSAAPEFDLSRYYATLSPLVEDGILRKATLILGAVTIFAAMLLFGREEKVRAEA